MQTLPQPSGDLAIPSKYESSLDGLQGFYVQYFSNSNISPCRQGGYHGKGSEPLMGQSGIGGKEAWSFRNFLSPPVTLSLEGGVVAWRMRGALTRDIEHFIEVGGLSRCVFTGVMLTAVQKSLQPLTPPQAHQPLSPGFHTSLGQAPLWPALSGPHPPLPQGILSGTMCTTNRFLIHTQGGQISKSDGMLQP